MPEVVCFVSAYSSKAGFTHVQGEDRFFSRNSLCNWIASKLEGYAAEIMVFGEEYLTSGSAGDVEAITSGLSQAIRDNGMGPLPSLFCKTRSALNHSIQDEGALEQEIQQWIERGLDTINKTLKEQHTLLLKMAQYLADHPRMEQHRILDYCRKYGHGFDPNQLKEAGSNHYNRQKLMEGRE
jgi:ATP-dependent Zn protease